jgi:hypothetical protein
MSWLETPDDACAYCDEPLGCVIHFP